MKKGLIFSLEVLLVLLSTAALVYSLQTQYYSQSFSPWRAKLLAEDVVDSFATQSIQGKASLGQAIALAGKLGSYCVNISYRGEGKNTDCSRVAGNEISARRTIFDGNSFDEVTVNVRYG